MKFSTFYNLVMGIYKKVVMLAGEWNREQYEPEIYGREGDTDKWQQ